MIFNMTAIDLNIQDRVSLTNVLAEKQAGNRIEMSLIYSLLKEIEFTPTEIEELGIISEGEMIKAKKDTTISVNLSDQQYIIISDLLGKLNNEDRLHIQLVPLWDKLDAAFK